MAERVELFTDGACRGNPGPGGWGVILRYKGKEKTLSGAEVLTTNNRMELIAAIAGLEALTRPCEVAITTGARGGRRGGAGGRGGGGRREGGAAGREPV